MFKHNNINAFYAIRKDQIQVKILFNM